MEKDTKTRKPVKTFETILSEIEALDYYGKKKALVLNKIVSLIVEIGRLPVKVKKSEVIDLFDGAYAKFGNDSFKFILKLFMLQMKFNTKNTNFNQLTIYETLTEKISEFTLYVLRGFDINSNDFECLSTYQFKDYLKSPELIKHIVSNIYDLAQRNMRKISREEISSILYVYILSKNQKRSDFYELALYVEKTIAEIIAQSSKRSITKHLWIDVPKILLTSKPKVQMEKITYLYYGTSEYIHKVQSEKAYVVQKMESLTHEVNSFNQQLISLRLENATHLKTINSLNDQIVYKQSQQDDANREFRYEKNMLEMQYKTMKDGLSSSLKRDFELEVLGIKDTIQNFPENEKKMIQRRIENIYQIVRSIGAR